MSNGMTVKDFIKRRTKYMEATRARKEERINAGEYDTPFQVQVLEEMIMDLIVRLEKVEKLLGPTEE